jgi:hypothetical protein
MPMESMRSSCAGLLPTFEQVPPLPSFWADPPPPSPSAAQPPDIVLRQITDLNALHLRRAESGVYCYDVQICAYLHCR